MNNEYVLPFFIKELLGGDSRYLVPMYQRNYAWGEGEINQLIQDVADYKQKRSGDQTYYIGTLVVYERTDGRFEVIDGQQRFTTLSLIATCLKRSVLDEAAAVDMTWFDIPNIDFESRPHSIATFEALSRGVDVHKLRGDTYNEDIVNGFELIERSLKSLGDQLPGFCDYLFSKVQITRVKVPEDTDLNHYFEVMNSRGEQLEKHEVVKARLMSALNEIADAEDRKVCIDVLNKVWEATSSMGRYVQYGFTSDERHRLFGRNDWGRLEPKNFDELAVKLQTKINDTVEPASKSLENVLANAVSGISASKNADDSVSERFTSVINFSNFLMHVLRVFTETDIPLDDKQLIDQFDAELLGSEVKIDRVKDFTFALLKCKYLFDQFVIKREYTEGKDGWSLKRLHWYSSNSVSYINTLDKGEDGFTGLNRRVLMLLSAFHVSAPTLVYKHWLNGALFYLYQQDEVSGSEYLAALERLARSFVFGRFLVEGDGADYFEIIYKSSKLEVIDPLPNEKLRYGGVQNNFVFNYLDYLLWCKDGTNKKQDDVIRQFEFMFRSSVEHFYPQHPIHEGDAIENHMLHAFGNLCLISHSKNSRLSNYLPPAKENHFRENITQRKIDSLKLYKMLQMLEKKDSWNIDEIRTHGEDMLKVLIEARDKSFVVT